MYISYVTSFLVNVFLPALYCVDQLTWWLHLEAAHSCRLHGMAAVSLTWERPGNVIPALQTFTVLGVHSYPWSMWAN